MEERGEARRGEERRGVDGDRGTVCVCVFVYCPTHPNPPQRTNQTTPPQCFNRTDYKRVPRLQFIKERPTDEQMEAIKEENAGAGSAEAVSLKDKVKVKAEQNDRTAPRPYRTHF